MRTVEVEKITGSVGRYKDFDGSFLPLKKSMTQRWGRIDHAYHRGVELPAVSLYKIGGAYFVRDGNHLCGEVLVLRTARCPPQAAFRSSGRSAWWRPWRWWVPVWRRWRSRGVPERKQTA